MMISSLALPITTDDDKVEGNDELFRSLRGFLIFGRIIGLLPYKGIIFSSTSETLRFSWISFPSIFTYTILSVLTFNSCLELLSSISASKKNAYEIAQSVRSTLYYLWGTFIYFNFILRSKQFLEIFHSWRTTQVRFSKPDTKLKRDVTLIAVVILASAILENSTLYVRLAQDIMGTVSPSSKSTLAGVFRHHYTTWHRSWARYLDYHPILFVLIFVQHKFILLSWNCMDIWITVLGRALYFKFQTLCEVAEKQLVRPFKEDVEGREKPSTTMGLPLPDQQDWKRLARDHAQLTELLQAFESFLSPLIFISYAVNIYYICMQLLDGLTLDMEKHTTTIADKINKPWSFAHLVMRLYLLSICCARVNVYAHQITTVINNCPEECYNNSISRLDKRVNGGREIGLTGLGSFTVTKPFILTILSVVFTVEIVLLQVIPTEDSSVGSQGKNCCCS